MPTERDKMLVGELYDPLDPELVRAREPARSLCQDLNATREADQEARRHILTSLFGKGGETVWLQPQFFCDYGTNTLLGERVFFYTATHPMNAELRRKQEFAKSIEIGSDVWVGGDFTVTLVPAGVVLPNGTRTRGIAGSNARITRVRILQG